MGPWPRAYPLRVLTFTPTTPTTIESGNGEQASQSAIRGPTSAHVAPWVFASLSGGGAAHRLYRRVGEAGAFISKDHKRFKISPAFGYAGFVVPEQHVHALSRDVAITKQKFYSLLCGDGEEDPRNYAPTWERKGSDLLSKHAMGRAGRQEVVELRSLLARISSNYGGKLFYFVREKPIGSPGQVWGKNTDNNWENKREERTLECLSEAINRLCRYAEHEDQNILLFQDMINEKQRFHQVRRSYAHIYGRIKEHQEMLRILEAPAYIDSELSTNIQCADWIAALIGRACDYQLVLNSSLPMGSRQFFR